MQPVGFFRRYKGTFCMTVDRYIRLIAGAMVILAVALGCWVNPY
jgi:hypothetical protein